MEKLLNLLQEFYGENRKFSNDDGILTMTNGVENLSGAYAQTYIISKQGGFIKWLVENDKIDREQFYDKARNIITDFDLIGEYEGACNEIIMLLAIKDEPIRFLCEIIK